MRTKRMMLIGAALAMATAIVPAASANAAAIGGGELGDTATLLARGAAISVPVTFSCATDAPPIAYATLGITVAQRQGKALVQGTGWVNLLDSCNAASGPVQVQVTVSGNGPFKAGVAYATANVEVCDNDSCSFTPTEKTIRLTR